MADLQEHYAIQHAINKTMREQNELMFRTCAQQDRLNDQLTERGELLKGLNEGLKERMEEYEALFSVRNHSSTVRMN